LGIQYPNLQENLMPTVFVQLGHPSNENPGGIVGQGEYTEVNGVVTLTKYNGQPIARRKQFSHKLKAGEDARKVAGRLTKDYAWSLHSNRPFSGPIHYPPISVV
jgi:hypothetical protein